MLLDAEVARTWNDVLTRIDTPPARAVTRRRRRVSRRVLAAVVIAVVSLASVAAAKTNLVDRLTDSEDRPAERMEVFDNEPSGTNGLSPLSRLFSETSVVSIGGSSYDMRQLRTPLLYRHDGLVVRVRSAPGDDGKACIYIEVVRRQGLTTCGTMQHNGHLTVMRFGDNRSGAHIVGLVDDHVRRVDIELPGGRAQPAILANNAYIFYLGDFHAQATGVRAHLDDGTTLAVDMSGCIRADSSHSRTWLGCGQGPDPGPHGGQR
jgi:hypothetical protein